MSGISIPETLRARFRERLAERVVTLEATVAVLDEGDARASLERQLHSLAGIAGTYGFPHLTELARAAELRCGAGASAMELRYAVSVIADAAMSDRAPFGRA